MPGPQLDPERVAIIVATAQTAGVQTAADKFGISRKTVQRYIKRAEEDAASAPQDTAGDTPGHTRLSQRVREYKAKTYEHLGGRMREALDVVLSRMTVVAAEEEDLFKLSGAAKILGELQHEGRVLDVELGYDEAEEPASSEGTPEGWRVIDGGG